MDRITDTHVYFWGSVFSNWAEAHFEHDGEIFENSEQAFIWEKALCFKDYEIANKILLINDPKLVKALGRKVKNFDDNIWLKKRYQVMLDVCYAKFQQNPELKKILLSTGNKIIVEASLYDKIWGVGLHWKDDAILDKSNWKGENLLGKILMEVRNKIK